jgi:hypothetical protein
MMPNPLDQVMTKMQKRQIKKERARIRQARNQETKRAKMPKRNPVTTTAPIRPKMILPPRMPTRIWQTG